MPSDETPSLKNAWIRKDADGHYYLFVKASDGKSTMINLTATNPSLDERIKAEINPDAAHSGVITAAFESWLAEQDQSLVKVEKPDDEFPDVIPDN